MKRLLLILLALLNSGCVYYTEKQSEAFSQNVYAANDSLVKARVDLAWFYSTESTKFISPPKHPIKISAIYKQGAITGRDEQGGKTRIVIIPDQYRNDEIVVVGSKEYQALLRDKEIKKQLEFDNKNMASQLTINQKELAKQQEMNNKMVKDLNHLQSQVYKKDATILRLVIVLGITWLLIAGYIYLRVKRLLFF